MAENLTQFANGRLFLQQCKQHGLAKDAVHQLSQTVAQIVEEALAGIGQQPQQQQQQINGVTKPVQQQQQQQSQAAVRDLQQAETVLPGLPLMIPRGKFDVSFFSDCLQLSNKQMSAVVPYSSIQHVLVIDAIPKQPSTTNIVLVMKSGCPVTQGKNQLDLISIQTKDTPELCIPAPAACSHFGESLTGAAPIVLSQLLASFLPEVSDDTFLTADSSVFSSSAGDLMVAANRGATPGWLVPLPVGLCFLGKPGRFLAAASIRKVVFHRAGGGSATFDVTFRFNAAAAGSSSSSKPLELGQIDAAELLRLQEYFARHGIRMGTDDDDDDDDEEEPAAAAGAPVSKVAAAGGGGAAAAAAAGDDDDSEEEDDDYDPEAAEEPPSKRRRSSSAAAAAGGGGGKDAAAASGDEEEEEESGSSGGEGCDDGSGDSDDVSLVDEAAMDDSDDEAEHD